MLDVTLFTLYASVGISAVIDLMASMYQHKLQSMDSCQRPLTNDKLALINFGCRPCSNQLSIQSVCALSFQLFKNACNVLYFGHVVYDN